MCTVLLPPGDNPIAVNKYIVSYHCMRPIEGKRYKRNKKKKKAVNKWKGKIKERKYLFVVTKPTNVYKRIRVSYTYLLTPWRRVLLEKLTGFAASQQIPRIYGTRKFITVLTSAINL
jgi:hypothetical protein